MIMIRVSLSRLQQSALFKRSWHICSTHDGRTKNFNIYIWNFLAYIIKQTFVLASEKSDTKKGKAEREREWEWSLCEQSVSLFCWSRRATTTTTTLCCKQMRVKKPPNPMQSIINKTYPHESTCWLSMSLAKLCNELLNEQQRGGERKGPTGKSRNKKIGGKFLLDHTANRLARSTKIVNANKIIPMNKTWTAAKSEHTHYKVRERFIKGSWSGTWIVFDNWNSHSRVCALI